MEFAPKLDAGISYERPQQVTAPVDYGRALTSGVSDVLKVLEDLEEDKPTWSQAKDEAKSAGNRAFNSKLSIIDQLKDQGKPGAAARAGQALVQWAAENDVDMNDSAIKAQLEARSIVLAEIGETPQDTYERELLSTPEYAQAEVIVLTSKAFEDMTPGQQQNEIRRQASQSMLDKATIAAAKQNGVTAWYAGGSQATANWIKTNIQYQVAEAQAAAGLGIQINPTQMEAKATEIAGMLAGMASIFPVGLPDVDREKAKAPLKAALNVIEALQSRGTDVSAGSIANLIGALSSNTDPESAAVVASLAASLRNLTPDTMDLILKQDAGSVAAALKAMTNPDAKTFYFGAGESQWGYGKRVRKSSDPLSKTLEGPDGKPAIVGSAEEFSALVGSAEEFSALVGLDTLQKNMNADPLKLLTDFITTSKTLDLMKDPSESTDAAAFNFGLMANAASAVYSSKVTFSAEDVQKGYSPIFFKKLERYAKLYPGQTAGVTRATQVAVQTMTAKAVVRVEDATQGWLQYDGSTLLLDYSKFTSREFSVGGNPETQTRMQTEVKAAVESAGGFSEFLKRYDSYDRSQGRSPYSAFVRNFMNSNEVRDVRKQLPAIRQQTKAIVALRQTSVRLEAMLGKIANDTRDEIYNAGGESAGANVPLVSSPVPTPGPPPDLPVEPVVVQEPERLGGILGMGGFPKTDGVSLGESAVGKVGEALGDAASRVGAAIISPAGASTLHLQENLRKLPVPKMLRRVADLEGKTNKPYKIPGEKHYTVGFGHYGPDVDPNKEYSDAEVEEFLKKDSVKFLRLMSKELPDLESYSEGLQVELFQAFYRGDFPKISPKALKLLKNKQWNAAADEFLNNKEYKNAEALDIPGIKPRMEAVAEAIRQEGQNSSSSSFREPPVPRSRPTNQEITATVTQTVPDATPEEVKEATDSLQGAITLDDIRALGTRQRAIMASILYAYSEEEQ